MEIPKTFLGYKREDGRTGTRNHVIILPVDDISNACAEAVANNIKGTIALPHSYGRLQFGADLELHFRTMIGTGKNPNVAAVIVIGIEPKWTKRIVDAIAYDTFIKEDVILETVANGTKNLGNIAQFILDYSKDLPVFYGLTSVVLAVVLGIGAAILRNYISKWNKAREAKLKA